uniref:Uncharacterized protein n=1 Tax=Arundo donax TaxID=35708 RepID=A0A0A9HIU1_ARUDO
MKYFSLFHSSISLNIFFVFVTSSLFGQVL